MSEDSHPHHKESFIERLFHPGRHHDHGGRHHEGEDTKGHHDAGDDRVHDDHPSHEDEPREQHDEAPKSSRRRNSMQRFKDYMRNQEDPDEAGQTYAGLM